MPNINLPRIGWQNGTLISKAKVEINGIIYEVEPEEYSGSTPLSAENLIQMEDNTENAINEVAEQGTPTILATLTSGTSETVTVPDLKQYRYILLQCNYHTDINRVMGSVIGTYEQFKASNIAWNCSSGDINNYLATAKYNSDTSVTLGRKGTYDATVLIGIK